MKRRGWTQLKKDDVVMVIAGKEKGKSGRILKLLPKKNRVIVEKVNMIKRHTKPTRQMPQGGVLEKEGSIHVSNVMIICHRCNVPVRIGKRIMEDGSKVRVCRKCGEVLDK
jgi:large subunit ribosomal protein L24